MAGAPRLLARSVELGLVEAGMVASGRVVLASQTHSNLVHRLTLDGRVIAYVKRPGTASVVDGDDLCATETAVLTLVAGEDLAAGLIPARSSELWTRPVEGTPFAALGVLAPAHGTALGVALARWHRTPRATAPRASAPWPLREGIAPSMQTDRPNPAQQAVLDLASDDIVTAVRRSLSWRPLALTHGDVALGNIVLGPDGRARFLDVELGGLGDPVWDLVSALALCRSHGRETEASFVRAYAASGLDPAVGAAWWLVRELVTAWQYAHFVHDAESIQEHLSAVRRWATAAHQESA